MKEIKITPPEGYEIDKENSTFDCIKFKPIIKKFRDNDSIQFNGWYIDHNNANINHVKRVYNTKRGYNIFATEKQAKSALAMARISQIIANDERFGGIITDEEWNDGKMKFTILREHCKIQKYNFMGVYCLLAFHTDEQRELFIKENEDLIKDYLMID